jgi:carbamoyl-phosphate synthase large subunit
VFLLRKSSADHNYLLPATHYQGFGRALRHVVEQAKIDVIIPTTDDDVCRLGHLRAELGSRVFLPRQNTIELCQDKYALVETLTRHGVPVPTTCAVTDLNTLEELFRRLEPASRLWCRARRGTGSAAAIPVTTPAQARAWIAYWEEMRGLPHTAFTISEYLPGRDFACQTLWDAGTPILAKTTERLSYFGGRNNPSGTSSIGALHKTVNAPLIVETSLAAVRAVDPAASGAFSVDLKEDATGRPCVTEINVGRFLTGTSIFDLTGKHNMAVTYVRLALKERVNIDHVYDVVEDYYMVRDLDALPDIFHADSLYHGIEDARAMGARPKGRTSGRSTWADHHYLAKIKRSSSPLLAHTRPAKMSRRTTATSRVSPMRSRGSSGNTSV